MSALDFLQYLATVWNELLLCGVVSAATAIVYTLAPKS
jgi:hypothetical protein